MPSFTAIVHIQINSDNPEEVSDVIVRDLIDEGFDATLDDIVEHDAPDLPNYSYFCFVRDALECGHGQKFKATFCCRRIPNSDHFCIESVDVSAGLDNAPEYGIGGVGGELLLECPRNSDGSFNFEQMCRDWLGVWHRQFVGTTEESIFGLYLIIRQIVAEGQWIK